MLPHAKTGEPGGRGPGLTGRLAASRVLPVGLLAALTVLGLRTAPVAPHWDGPLHTDGAAVAPPRSCCPWRAPAAGSAA